MRFVGFSRNRSSHFDPLVHVHDSCNSRVRLGVSVAHRANEFRSRDYFEMPWRLRARDFLREGNALTSFIYPALGLPIIRQYGHAISHRSRAVRRSNKTEAVLLFRWFYSSLAPSLSSYINNACVRAVLHASHVRCVAVHRRGIPHTRNRVPFRTNRGSSLAACFASRVPISD
jgi:hypothetical protein